MTIKSLSKDNSKISIQKLEKEVDKQSNAYWKQILKQGKTFLNLPIVFLFIFICATFTDFFQIKDGIFRANENWSVNTLNVLSLAISIILNGAMKLLNWLLSFPQKTKRCIFWMITLVIIMLVLYGSIVSIKWNTRYKPLTNHTTQTSQSVSDPALAALQNAGKASYNSNTQPSTSDQDPYQDADALRSEPEHNLGTDLTTFLSCLIPLITNAILGAISFDPNPYGRELMKQKKKRKKLIKLRDQIDQEIELRTNKKAQLEMEAESIMNFLSEEKTSGVKFFGEYLDLHSRYTLAKHLKNPEAITYLIQENAYVERLFGNKK